MAVATTHDSLAGRNSNRHVLRAVIASCAGWSLDLYDLFLLVFVAPTIGRLFFPSEHAMLSMAAVYASFGVTLMMCPLGSAQFGTYADVRGRKRAMIASRIGVGVSTALFGTLPTVATVGSVAPILFLLLRLVQECLSASSSRPPTPSAPNRWRRAGVAPFRA